MNKLATIICGAVALASCSHAEQPVATAMPAAPLLTGKPAQALPGTTVFKMNGDWSNYVPVTVNSAGTALVSYPDPRDVSEANSPVALKDGWWLDRRGGMGANTRFTRYTWAEYHSLSTVPTQSQLLQAIIPDARVTTTRTLDIPIGTATPEQCNELL